MATMVFVNFPVRDLEKATDFYEKLGFEKNEEFSNGEASAMIWDDNFWIMLLTHSVYQKFVNGKTINDAKKTTGVLIAFSMESVAAVKAFGRRAKENGGHAYHIDMGIPEEQMYGLEVEDLDGNILEPNWMAMP